MKKKAIILIAAVSGLLITKRQHKLYVKQQFIKSIDWKIEHINHPNSNALEYAEKCEQNSQVNYITYLFINGPKQLINYFI
jgi:hypothetical protein